MGSAHTDTPHVSSNVSTRSLRVGDAPLASRVCHAWHDPFICVTWLAHTWHIHILSLVTWLIHTWHILVDVLVARGRRAIGIPSLLYVTRPIHSRDFTYSYVAYTCTTIDDTTHSYMTHTSLCMRHVINGSTCICHVWISQVTRVNGSSESCHEWSAWVMSSHDSFIRLMTWLISRWDIY